MSHKQLDPIEQAMGHFLEPFSLTEDKLKQILSSILENSVDFADLYFQHTQQESWSLEDSIIKSGSFNIEQGVGVRAISSDKTGFAYSEDINLPSLKEAANAARSIVKSGGDKVIKVWDKNIKIPQLYIQDNPLTSISDKDKIDLLKRLDHYARKLDSKVNHVVTSLSGSHEIILVIGTDGTWQADIRPLVRLNVNVIAESKSKREQASNGGGGRYSYEIFLNNDCELGLQYVEAAVRQALIKLEAIQAPAGSMPVVLGPGWPGVLLHEAIGHGLEGDFNRKGSSAFTNRLGEKVASDLCTVVDDGTLKNKRGSLTIDDEGTPTQCTTLIEKGILKNYMHDKLNAKLMNTKSTGNGRRESYAHLPMPRMTNTYMLPGISDPAEIISSVKKGLYAVNFSGGQVDITSGKFVFDASESYLIENGKITTPVKGATLIGDGPDILTKVKMLGNDLKLDQGIGVCGKEGQSVPVGVGQPTMLISEMTVGGTN